MSSPKPIPPDEIFIDFTGVLYLIKNAPPEPPRPLSTDETARQVMALEKEWGATIPQEAAAAFMNVIGSLRYGPTTPEVAEQRCIELSKKYRLTEAQTFQLTIQCGKLLVDREKSPPEKFQRN
jgi:hypothetical protein